MQVVVEEEGRGIHPNEVVVAIRTAEGGVERLVVHRRSIENARLEIGYPISEDGNNYLIELPRETMRGLWRIWVSQKNVFDLKTRRSA